LQRDGCAGRKVRREPLAHLPVIRQSRCPETPSVSLATLRSFSAGPQLAGNTAMKIAHTTPEPQPDIPPPAERPPVPEPPPPEIDDPTPQENPVPVHEPPGMPPPQVVDPAP
jgi:hypothetical protein